MKMFNSILHKENFSKADRTAIAAILIVTAAYVFGTVVFLGRINYRINRLSKKFDKRSISGTRSANRRIILTEVLV
jgi:hypothetical protein